MGIGDEISGKAKEVRGKLTDDESTRKEGQAQQEKADAEYEADQADQKAAAKKDKAEQKAAEEQNHS